MEEKSKKRGKDQWDELSIFELTSRMASRYGRIEVLKLEIKKLQELIEKKS